MDKISKLPDDTKLFVGHEYTKKNFEFCFTAEGASNPNILEAWEKIYAPALSSGAYSVPSILANERLYNVFMRCRTAELQAAVGKKDPKLCMQILREWKTKGAKPKY